MISIRIIISFIFTVILFGCANQLPPSGGPIDLEAPKIVKTYPPNGSLNYDKNFVEFEFSEYINKRSLTNAVFISPYFTDEVDQKWSGKKLRLIFPEKLKENKTYVISLGTDITDLRGNKLEESYTLTFSTGGVIDQGIISGRVYDKKPDGISIFFFMIDTLNKTVDYTSTKPNFVCQTSKDGSFIIYGLPYGIFRVVAVRDQMRNLIYDINEDEIGLPFRDIVLNDTSFVIKNVQIEMTRFDTTKPVLSSVRFVDMNHIRLIFNETIDIKSVDLGDVVIIDTISKQSISPLGFYLDDKTSLMFVINNLKEQQDYHISISGVKDLFGNEIDSALIVFSTELEKDTTPIFPKTIQCNHSTYVMEYFNAELNLIFNDYVMFNDFLNSFSITDTMGKKIEYELIRPDSSSFYLKFGALKQKEKFIIKIDCSSLVDLAGNKLDSVITLTIETNSDGDYSLISGFLKNKTENLNKIVVEARSISTNKSYSIETANDKYQIKNVLPGSYFIKVSIPQEKQSDYKSFVKPFNYYPDTIKVKSRWPTTDVNFNLNELLGQ